jgi:hypothetical protein
MEAAALSFLRSVQRCTRSVFQQWSRHCGRFVALGHQHSGVPVEASLMPAFDSVRGTIAGGRPASSPGGTSERGGGDGPKYFHLRGDAGTTESLKWVEVWRL